MLSHNKQKQMILISGMKNGLTTSAKLLMMLPLIAGLIMPNASAGALKVSLVC
jgi:hypothetical protein